MNALLRTPQGELRHNEPMSRHTSWRVGGPAEYFFRPESIDDLAEFLAGLPADMPVMWLGLGSNLLVRDGGIAGVVIHTPSLLKGMRRLDDTRIEAEAGLACTQLARRCVRLGLGPAEFLAGIPGTVGGALAMNAGSFGTETWELVESVRTLDRRGERHLRTPDAYKIAYRQVDGPADEWFLSAVLKLRPAEEGAEERLRELMARRQQTQPLGRPSCGSVFRNPPGDFAARLIESAGLKGLRVGGAAVSDKHANFILNDNRASAADIEALIEQVASRVAAVHGVQLKREVHIVGKTA